jgi:hypothetical protein
MKAPPPVAITLRPSSISRAITRRSPSRKPASPYLSKYLGNAHPRRMGDLLIGIDEGQAEARGKAAADGGFANPHHADQHNRPVIPRFLKICCFVACRARLYSHAHSAQKRIYPRLYSGGPTRKS